MSIQSENLFKKGSKLTTTYISKLVQLMSFKQAQRLLCACFKIGLASEATSTTEKTDGNEMHPVRSKDGTVCIPSERLLDSDAIGGKQTQIFQRYTQKANA